MQEPAETENYDLSVFTAQEPEEWKPVIKEFEERTGWNVKVETGSAKEMLSRLENKEAEWDVAFWYQCGCIRRRKGNTGRHIRMPDRIFDRILCYFI